MKQQTFLSLRGRDSKQLCHGAVCKPVAAQGGDWEKGICRGKDMWVEKGELLNYLSVLFPLFKTRNGCIRILKEICSVFSLYAETGME